MDKKICPGGRDSLAQKIFPGVARGGCTQLELTETLQPYHDVKPGAQEVNLGTFFTSRDVCLDECGHLNFFHLESLLENIPALK